MAWIESWIQTCVLGSGPVQVQLIHMQFHCILVLTIYNLRDTHNYNTIAIPNPLLLVYLYPTHIIESEHDMVVRVVVRQFLIILANQVSETQNLFYFFTVSYHFTKEE